MKRLPAVIVSMVIAMCSISAWAADDMAMTQKTRAQVVEELRLAIKNGDLIEPFTHKTFKEIYPNRYPMSDSDADKMAKEMMKNMPMMK
jgi:Domain of unknown function (DUF4148)